MISPTNQAVFLTTLRRVKNKERIVGMLCTRTGLSSLGRLFFLIFSKYDFLLVPATSPGQAFQRLCRDFYKGKPTLDVPRDLGKHLLYSASEKMDLQSYTDKLLLHLRGGHLQGRMANEWSILTLFLECYEELLNYVGVAMASEFSHPHSIIMVTVYRSQLTHHASPDMLVEDLMGDIAKLSPMTPEMLVRATVCYKNLFGEYLIQAAAERQLIKSRLAARKKT